MDKPKRIQLRRTKGWKKPEGAVVVSRPSKWGNPFVVGDVGVADAGEAVRIYRESLSRRNILTDVFIAAVKQELRGKDLLCWCPLNQRCHADVLLEIANAP